MLRKCYCLSFRGSAVNNIRKWQHAKDPGITWLNKHGSSLNRLQQNYNNAVATVLDLRRVDEDVITSDPLAPDLPLAPSGTSEGEAPADQNAALPGTSDQDLSPAPRAGPPPALFLRLCGPPALEEDEWPELDSQKTLKKISANAKQHNMQGAKRPSRCRIATSTRRPLIATSCRSSRAPSPRNASSQSAPSVRSK